MDILLLAVTVVSLTIAVVMTAVAWRFRRDDRTRSAARVAALAAATTEDNDATAVPTPLAVSTSGAVAPRVARVSSVAASGRAMSVPAATGAGVDAFTISESRPWAPARVSTFSPRPATVDDLPLTTTPLGASFLGGAVAQPESGRRQRGLVIAAMVLLIVLVAAGFWTVFGDKSNAVNAVSAAPAAAEESPLELMSLRSERRGPRLAVTGLVRNPAAGAELNRLAAVVFLFDQQGGFITSARADVDFVKLAPGDESPFVIAVDAPTNVARYRVSFRNDAGVVPHIDRRGDQPVATTGAFR